MTAIQVPDAIAPTLERFIHKLIEKGIDKLTFGQFANSEMEFVARELKSLAQQPHRDASDASLMDRAKIELQRAGEAFISPSGLEVSSRVLTWCLNAFAKQESMGLDEAQAIFDSKPDGDRFWWFMQLLDDPALEALIQVLEKEREG